MYIRVGIADDHKVLSEGIRQLLEFDGRFYVVYEVNNGEECLEKLRNSTSCYIDILILDINMPKASGLDVLRVIRELKYPVKVIILTENDEISTLRQAIEYKAEGYILKNEGFSQLVNAINAVYNGKTFIQPELVMKLNEQKVKEDVSIEKIDLLSQREKEVLMLLSGGKQNKEIAADLCISERTVKNHITSIFKKINVCDRTQAAVYAIRHCIL